MGNSSRNGLKAALDAIRDDANKWNDAANQMAQVSAVCGELKLQAVHFSYIGDKLGLTGAYSGLQEKMALLANEAARSFGDLSRTLNDCANDYEKADQDAIGAAHEVKKEMPS